MALALLIQQERSTLAHTINRVDFVTMAPFLPAVSTVISQVSQAFLAMCTSGYTAS